MSDHNLQLHSPVAISGKWQFDWFDPAHHHSLLYQDGYFYIVNYLEDNPVQTLFCIQNDLPTKILYARVSLSKEFIAIQLNFTNVLVLDIITRKKYLLEIKSTYDGSCILPQGIIWSDHGGGTQDLIIVTNKALEFYKISSKKLYCKSTRNINHNAFAFWYNHEHRMILTASYRQNNTFLSRIQKVNSGINAANQKEVLIMEGYFLKAEARSGMLLLELPPPDRMPRFELGPGVSGDSIYLLSVYGKLLVLVQYTQENQDYFTVYSLQKTAHEKVATLALGSVIKQLKLSTYDNLIICHDLDRQQSLLFDILAAPREKTSVTATPVIDPLMGPCAVAFSQHVEIEDPDSTIPGKRSNFSKNLISPPKSSGTGHQSARIYEIKNLSFTLNPEIILNTGASAVSPSKRDSMDEISSKMTVTVTDLSQPHQVASFYDPLSFEIEPIDYVYHKSERVLWRLKVSLPEILEQYSNPRDKLLFLARRGRYYFQANRQQYEDNPVNHAIFGNQLASKEAKQRLLATVYECITLPPNRQNSKSAKNISAETMEAIYSLTDTYLREYHRLRCLDSGSSQSNGGSGGNGNTSVTNGLNNSDIDLKSIDLELCEFYLQRFASTTATGNITSNDLFAFYRSNLEPNYHRYLFSAIEQTRLLAMTCVNTRSQSPLPPGATNANGAANANAPPPSSLRMFKSRSVSMSAIPNSIPSSSVSTFSSSATVMSDIFLDMDVILNNDPLEPQSTEGLGGSSSSSHHPYLPDINLIGMKVKSWMTKKKPLTLVSTTSSSKLDEMKGNEPSNDQTEDQDDGSNKLSSLSKLNIANNTPNMDYVSISLRRDEKGDLVVSQTELLSYVWIPLLLSPTCDYMHCGEMLTNFMVALVERGIEVIPAFSMLHLHLLYYLKQYQDIRNYLSMSLYADNTEVAFMILQFAGMMEEEMRSQQANNNLSRIKTLQSCVSCFQTHGIDMLWRLKQYSAAVKWYLTHGFILEAMDLCKKRMGSAPSKIDQGSIAGIEFFISAVNYLKVGPNRSISAEQLLFHVYTFLSSWDPKLITVQTGSIRSKLAATVSFPDEVVKNPEAAMKLKVLFGFFVSTV